VFVQVALAVLVRFPELQQQNNIKRACQARHQPVQTYACIKDTATLIRRLQTM
jgi:hypothetical protein